MVSTLQNVSAGRELMDAAYLEQYLEQQEVWGSIAIDQGVNMVHSKQKCATFLSNSFCFMWDEYTIVVGQKYGDNSLYCPA
jgi:hypothetical protein